eukprot:SM000022S07216  [mRNA]  locus=s22:481121:481738:- [translate_table: standard]
MRITRSVQGGRVSRRAAALGRGDKAAAARPCGGCGGNGHGQRDGRRQRGRNALLEVGRLAGLAHGGGGGARGGGGGGAEIAADTAAGFAEYFVATVAGRGSGGCGGGVGNGGGGGGLLEDAVGRRRGGS